MEKSEGWRDCVNWLVRCEVLRPDHLTCQAEANIEDLAHTLRDGELLCRLVNTLEPDCIDMDNIHLNPQTIKCLCMQNINSFLKACHDVFSIKDDLFNADELYDLSGFNKVLATLSQLSNTPQSLERTKGGFRVRLSAVNEIQIREVGLRRSFELCENASVSSHRESKRQDAIYEKLILKKPAFSVNNRRKKEKRDYIIEEILANEKSYLQGVLKIVTDYFMTPLETVLTSYDVQAIFGSLKLLAALHERFYEDLQNSVDPENNHVLSKVFLRYYEEFFVYGEYCANLPAAQELLKCITKDDINVKYKLDECQAALKNGRFFLCDLLVVPMQHILKYRLLLDRLLKETKEDHPEHYDMLKAHEAMIDVNNYVNDVKRDREALHTIEKIEGRITHLSIPGNKTLKDFGHLHKDDELRIKFMDHKIGNRYVFVFDQVMLICKVLKDNMYACEEVLQLLSYNVKGSQSPGRWGHHFILTHKMKTNAYIIFARNGEHKKAWIKAILEALDNMKPEYANHNYHCFHIYTFDKPTLCFVCHKSLKGLIMQGYVCTYCNISVHKTCLEKLDVCKNIHIITKEQIELPPPPYSYVTNWNDYRFLGQYKWFVGIMTRAVADKRLRCHGNGTFMVRISPKYHNNAAANSGQSEYAISMKTDSKVIHMLVYKRINNGTPQYYLSEVRFFPTIVELVDYYSNWSLQENFEDYNEKLIFPIGLVSESNIMTSENNSPDLQEDEGEEYKDYLDVNKIDTRIVQNATNVSEFPGTGTVSEVLHTNTIPQQNQNIIPEITIHNSVLVKTAQNQCNAQTESGQSSPHLEPVTKNPHNCHIISGSGYAHSDSVNKQNDGNLQEKSEFGGKPSGEKIIFDEHFVAPIMNKSVPDVSGIENMTNDNQCRHDYPMKVPTASQTEHISPIYAKEDSYPDPTSTCHADIENFGEYVVAALKLIRNPISLKATMSGIRKVINDKLDDE